MLLKRAQARLQSMKHRDGAIGLLSLLNQLVNDHFLPSNTLLGEPNVSLGLGQIVLLKSVVHGGKLTQIEVLHAEALAFGDTVRATYFRMTSRTSCVGMSRGIQAALVSSTVSASLRANHASRAACSASSIAAKATTAAATA